MTHAWQTKGVRARRNIGPDRPLFYAKEEMAHAGF
jgi:hypothetical protein